MICIYDMYICTIRIYKTLIIIVEYFSSSICACMSNTVVIIVYAYICIQLIFMYIISIIITLYIS